MTTVTSKKTGNKYEIESQLYGTSNLVHRLFFGGIQVATTASCSTAKPSLTLTEAIIVADKKSEELEIEIDDKN